MFPTRDEEYIKGRLKLGTELPWEPWLHAGVWCSVLLTMVLGETHLFPPVDAADWTWILVGLIAPPVGFTSQWLLAFNTGRLRYWGLWLRMIADIGLVVAISGYLCNRWYIDHLFKYDIMADVVLMLAAWFTAALVYRDMKFLVATEKLASKLRAGGYST